MGLVHPTKSKDCFMAYTLFSAQTTNATSSVQTLPTPDVRNQRLPLTVYAFGTFGGGTVKLQASPDGTNWIDVPSVSFTAAGMINVDLGAYQVRAVLSGATAPSVSLVLY